MHTMPVAVIYVHNSCMLLCCTVRIDHNACVHTPSFLAQDLAQTNVALVLQCGKNVKVKGVLTVSIECNPTLDVRYVKQILTAFTSEHIHGFEIILGK